TELWVMATPPPPSRCPVIRTSKAPFAPPFIDKFRSTLAWPDLEEAPWRSEPARRAVNGACRLDAVDAPAGPERTAASNVAGVPARPAQLPASGPPASQTMSATGPT